MNETIVLPGRLQAWSKVRLRISPLAITDPTWTAACHTIFVHVLSCLAQWSDLNEIELYRLNLILLIKPCSPPQEVRQTEASASAPLCEGGRSNLSGWRRTLTIGHTGGFEPLNRTGLLTTGCAVPHHASANPQKICSWSAHVAKEKQISFVDCWAEWDWKNCITCKDCQVPGPFRSPIWTARTGLHTVKTHGNNCLCI